MARLNKPIQINDTIKTPASKLERGVDTQGGSMEAGKIEVKAGFEDAHECWLKLGGRDFAHLYIHGPDDSFYRSDYWQIVREMVLKRDQSRCARCGGEANQVHHLSYRYIGQDHRSEERRSLK